MAEPHAGWAQAYADHTPKLAERLNNAAQQLVDGNGVIRSLNMMLPDGGTGQPTGSLRMIVHSVVAARTNRGVLGRPLVQVYKAGWKAGAVNAHRAMTVQKDDRAQPIPQPPRPTLTLLPSAPKITTHVDWPSWTPGSGQQAAAGQTLEDLIRDAVGTDEGWATRAGNRGSLLASIEDTRIGKLVDAVTQALADGTSVDDLGKTLTGVLDDPQWASMVADTELARSMTAASLTSYLDAGIQTVVWYAADDDRECVLCQENEDLGEIAISGDWPNGPPPVHPLCRCALGPGFTPRGANEQDAVAEDG